MKQKKKTPANKVEYVPVLIRMTKKQAEELKELEHDTGDSRASLIRRGIEAVILQHRAQKNIKKGA